MFAFETKTTFSWIMRKSDEYVFASKEKNTFLYNAKLMRIPIIQTDLMLLINRSKNRLKSRIG